MTLIINSKYQKVKHQHGLRNKNKRLSFAMKHRMIQSSYYPSLNHHRHHDEWANTYAPINRAKDAVNVETAFQSLVKAAMAAEAGNKPDKPEIPGFVPTDVSIHHCSFLPITLPYYLHPSSFIVASWTAGGIELIGIIVILTGGSTRE
jgi:hypothetical protein